MERLLHPLTSMAKLRLATEMSLLRCLDTAFAALGLSFVSHILVLRAGRLTGRRCAANVCHPRASPRMVMRSCRSQLINGIIVVGHVEEEIDGQDIVSLVEHVTLLSSCQKDTPRQPI